ncbi:MAG TPA: hypothetical protein VKY92_06970 [Verrucomicrobiae bacterium]|nr:hypothetical protein [Verrucomicrobiae bacterium]
MKSAFHTVPLIILIAVAFNPGPVSGADTAQPKAPVVALANPATEAARQRRLQWNIDTLVGDYDQHGHHDPKWDSSTKLALQAFARIRAGDTADEKLMSELASATRSAVTNGCDDPMLKYLYARFVSLPQDHTSQDHAELYRSTAEAMSQSERHPIRKFYAALRAAESFDMGSASTLSQVHKWRGEAKRFLIEVVRASDTPPGEVYDAWEGLLQATKKNKAEHDDAYLALDPLVFRNWSSDPFLLLLKGQFYTDYAWEARGSGFAKSVSNQGWQLFTERLEIAEAALTKAWKLNPQDPRIARQMITVELGQGQGRSRMEQWFQRAMLLDTNYYDACYAKLNYLQPKWYGSTEDMLEFAGECVNSPKWGGHVPLILLDAHELISASLDREARANYFRRPEVWADLKQAFDKFFVLNPHETGWHHNYAWYAYSAQQWVDLNRELQLLGPVNYNYFGGRAEFDKIVQAAKEHSVAPKSP